MRTQAYNSPARPRSGLPGPSDAELTNSTQTRQPKAYSRTRSRGKRRERKQAAAAPQKAERPGNRQGGRLHGSSEAQGAAEEDKPARKPVLAFRGNLAAAGSDTRKKAKAAEGGNNPRTAGVADAQTGHRRHGKPQANGFLLAGGLLPEGPRTTPRAEWGCRSDSYLGRLRQPSGGEAVACCSRFATALRGRTGDGGRPPLCGGRPTIR